MATGDKIAQKYIEKPLTLGGYKFTLRYVVSLASLLPLRLYTHNEYYLQLSNNKFILSEATFHDYETHFTVMNYGEKSDFKQLRCADFEPQFNEEYKGKI